MTFILSFLGISNWIFEQATVFIEDYEEIALESNRIPIRKKVEKQIISLSLVLYWFGSNSKTSDPIHQCLKIDRIGCQL